MPIVDLQRRITEAGRIRTGLQETFQRQDGSTGSRPAKLDTFRFTSADKRRIEQLAELYGGKVEPWQAPAGPQWQVVSTRNEIDVIVPPTDLGFSQHYELWSAGGCKRRCDGVAESITEGPCLCNPEDRECDIHTRLSVMLRDIPGLGVWRLDTQGWYAAHELIGAVEVITMAAGRGALLPARLRLDQRTVKRPDKNGKVVTLRYAVPVIDIEITPAQLLGGGQGQPLQIAASSVPPLTPVPMIAAPVPSIAEQSAPPPGRSKRANAAAPIQASGRQRAAQAAGARPQLPVGEATDERAPDVPADVDLATSSPASAPDFATTIRNTAAAADGDPDELATTAEVEALRAIFTGWRGTGIIAGGLRVIWPDTDAERLSGAQARAIAVVHDSMGREAFEIAWRAMIDEAAAS